MFKISGERKVWLRKFVRSPQGGLMFTFLLLLFFGYLNSFSFTVGWFVGFLVTFYVFFILVLFFQKFGLVHGCEIIATAWFRLAFWSRDALRGMYIRLKRKYGHTKEWSITSRVLRIAQTAGILFGGWGILTFWMYSFIERFPISQAERMWFTIIVCVPGVIGVFVCWNYIVAPFFRLLDKSIRITFVITR